VSTSRYQVRAPKRRRKDKGPKGPLKARFSGRMDGLYDDPNDVSE